MLSGIELVFFIPKWAKLEPSPKYSSEKMDIFLAFDNDPAGKGYTRQFQERYSGVIFTLDLPPQEGQDWNDVLQSRQPMGTKVTTQSQTSKIEGEF